MSAKHMKTKPGPGRSAKPAGPPPGGPMGKAGRLAVSAVDKMSVDTIAPGEFHPSAFAAVKTDQMQKAGAGLQAQQTNVLVNVEVDKLVSKYESLFERDYRTFQRDLKSKLDSIQSEMRSHAGSVKENGSALALRVEEIERKYANAQKRIVSLERSQALLRTAAQTEIKVLKEKFAKSQARLEQLSSHAEGVSKRLENLFARTEDLKTQTLVLKAATSSEDLMAERNERFLRLEARVDNLSRRPLRMLHEEEEKADSPAHEVDKIWTELASVETRVLELERSQHYPPSVPGLACRRHSVVGCSRGWIAGRRTQTREMSCPLQSFCPWEGPV